ncbi:MAG TPA: hypothetical protein VJR89_37130 [Polyangiales bacterium]|nr:hypothetical protein [Polyangiales bacterium]
MSDPVKGDKGPANEAKRDAPGSGSGAAPIRSPSQKLLFELDSPATSGMHSLDLPLGAAAPANDFVPLGARSGDFPAADNKDRESALIDAEFAALANTTEMEVPLVAAHASGAHKELRADTRALTHVPVDQDFDATLRLPRPNEEAIEARRGRLAVRYKAACAAYKLLTSFDLGGTDRREVVELFSAYESRLRAVLPPAAGNEAKRDADSLHSLLPAPGLDELERALSKIEDKLLYIDDFLAEDDFKSRVSKAKQPIKTLLRYARLLAARRFNIGYRRDRFEYLATELLTTEVADKRLRLLSRDKAATVLHHLLAGLPQPAAPEERGPATAHLREALDRLATIGSSKEFFESEFFLDLHGYKISMRDQITCPEFLYLSAALHVEIHNRMLDWASSGAPSWQALHSELEAQRAAAEDVFGNFRRPRSTPAAKSSPRPLPAKEAQPQPVPPRRKRKRKRISEEPPDNRERRLAWIKIIVASLVIVVSLASALYSAGVYEIGTPPVALRPSQLQQLSPLLLRGTLNEKQNRLDGLISRQRWLGMTKLERRAAAAELATQLAAKGIQNARLVTYKTPVIQIAYGTVVLVDESDAKP